MWELIVCTAGGQKKTKKQHNIDWAVETRIRIIQDVVDPLVRPYVPASCYICCASSEVPAQ